MNSLEKRALELMKTDALDIAEKSVGPGDAATMLGLLITQNLVRDKEDVFSVLGDTFFRMSCDACADLLRREGFEKVYHERHGDMNDAYEIWWHDAGLLVTFESYDCKHVNSLQVYYNWVPTSLDNAYRYTSSGGFEEMADGTKVWAGYYDGREGLLTHLKQLREHGYFLAHWYSQPFLWFLNYSESKEKDREYKAINKLKYVVLPSRVQWAIGSIN